MTKQPLIHLDALTKAQRQGDNQMAPKIQGELVDRFHLFNSWMAHDEK